MPHSAWDGMFGAGHQTCPGMRKTPPEEHPSLAVALAMQPSTHDQHLPAWVTQFA